MPSHLILSWSTNKRKKERERELPETLKQKRNHFRKKLQKGEGKG